MSLRLNFILVFIEYPSAIEGDNSYILSESDSGAGRELLNILVLSLHWRVSTELLVYVSSFHFLFNLIQIKAQVY